MSMPLWMIALLLVTFPVLATAVLVVVFINIENNRIDRDLEEKARFDERVQRVMRGQQS